MRRLQAISPVWHDGVAYAVGSTLPEMADVQAEALLDCGAATHLDPPARIAASVGSSDQDESRPEGVSEGATIAPESPAAEVSPAAAPSSRRRR